MDVILIHNKLRALQEYLEELEPLLQADPAKIKTDHTKLHAIERLFQLIVDTMVDINTHIIAEENLTATEDFQSTFITLAEHHVLPSDFALQVAPIVGLRNRIVHKYEKLDMSRFLNELKNDKYDIKQFMRLIKKYVDGGTGGNRTRV